MDNSYDNLNDLLALSGIRPITVKEDTEYYSPDHYDNEPNPKKYMDIPDMQERGNDLNRPKNMYKHSYKQGDNPITMRKKSKDKLANVKDIKRK